MWPFLIGGVMQLLTRNNYFVRLLGKERLNTEIKPFLFYVMDSKKSDLEYSFDDREINLLKMVSDPKKENPNVNVCVVFKTAFIQNVFTNKIIIGMYDFFYEFMVYIRMHSFEIRKDFSNNQIDMRFNVSLDENRMRVNNRDDIKENINWCVDRYPDNMKEIKLRWAVH